MKKLRCGCWAVALNCKGGVLSGDKLRKSIAEHLRHCGKEPFAPDTSRSRDRPSGPAD